MFLLYLFNSDVSTFYLVMLIYILSNFFFFFNLNNSYFILYIKSFRKVICVIFYKNTHTHTHIYIYIYIYIQHLVLRNANKCYIIYSLLLVLTAHSKSPGLVSLSICIMIFFDLILRYVTALGANTPMHLPSYCKQKVEILLVSFYILRINKS
jgi:hypothetical protein